MITTVCKKTLVKIIRRKTDCSIAEIEKIIDEHGAKYFNYTGLDIKYLGFGEWQINI